MKGYDFKEVVADPKTGAITKVEEISDAMDLNEAIEQKTAVAKATVPLLAARRGSGEGECQSPGGQHRPRAQERTGHGRGDPPGREHLQESDREARLSGQAGRAFIVQLVAARLASKSIGGLSRVGSGHFPF
jgi:hypothetical protein